MAEVRIGLIARGETSRGLGVQTQAIARELGVSAILTVDMATEYSSVGEVSAPGAESWTTDFDPRRSRISNLAMHWLVERSDVIISVETFYDWRIPAAAERAGVKTVLIGNPEFFRDDLPKPSAFWWPTEWMKQKLPRGTLMPHPAEPGHVVAPGFDGGVLKVLHPVGRPALEDRNGTQLFMDMLGLLKVPVRATVTTMGNSPAALAIPNNVELVVAAEEKGDRWSIYKDQHLMVLPRKYGGLCLPVIEALSCGLGVVMSECSPNEHWPTTLVPAARRGGIRTPFGHIPLHVTQPGILAKHVDLLHRQPETVARMRSRALEWAHANDWSTLAPRWRAELERLCAT